jgi:hypothetical protein
VDADALCMGQEFVKPGNAPPWVGEVVLKAASKVFSSSTHVNVQSRLPYFMNPVLAACQASLAWRSWAEGPRARCRNVSQRETLIDNGRRRRLVVSAPRNASALATQCSACVV